MLQACPQPSGEQGWRWGSGIQYQQPSADAGEDNPLRAVVRRVMCTVMSKDPEEHRKASGRHQVGKGIMLGYVQQALHHVQSWPSHTAEPYEQELVKRKHNHMPQQENHSNSPPAPEVESYMNSDTGPPDDGPDEDSSERSMWPPFDFHHPMALSLACVSSEVPAGTWREQQPAASPQPIQHHTAAVHGLQDMPAPAVVVTRRTRRATAKGPVLVVARQALIPDHAAAQEEPQQGTEHDAVPAASNPSARVKPPRRKAAAKQSTDESTAAAHTDNMPAHPPAKPTSKPRTHSRAKPVHAAVSSEGMAATSAAIVAVVAAAIAAGDCPMLKSALANMDGSSLQPDTEPPPPSTSPPTKKAKARSHSVGLRRHWADWLQGPDANGNPRYRNVAWVASRDRYRAVLYHSNTRKHLGYFIQAEAAARAADMAQLDLLAAEPGAMNPDLNFAEEDYAQDSESLQKILYFVAEDKVAAPRPVGRPPNMPLDCAGLSSDLSGQPVVPPRKRAAPAVPGAPRHRRRGGQTAGLDLDHNLDSAEAVAQAMAALHSAGLMSGLEGALPTPLEENALDMGGSPGEWGSFLEHILSPPADHANNAQLDAAASLAANAYLASQQVGSTDHPPPLVPVSEGAAQIAADAAAAAISAAVAAAAVTVRQGESTVAGALNVGDPSHHASMFSGLQQPMCAHDSLRQASCSQCSPRDVSSCRVIHTSSHDFSTLGEHGPFSSPSASIFSHTTGVCPGQQEHHHVPSCLGNRSVSHPLPAAFPALPDAPHGQPSYTLQPHPSQCPEPLLPTSRHGQADRDLGEPCIEGLALLDSLPMNDSLLDAVTAAMGEGLPFSNSLRVDMIRGNELSAALHQPDLMLAPQDITTIGSSLQPHRQDQGYTHNSFHSQPLQHLQQLQQPLPPLNDSLFSPLDPGSEPHLTHHYSPDVQPTAAQPINSEMHQLHAHFNNQPPGPRPGALHIRPQLKRQPMSRLGSHEHYTLEMGLQSLELARLDTIAPSLDLTSLQVPSLRFPLSLDEGFVSAGPQAHSPCKARILSQAGTRQQSGDHISQGYTHLADLGSGRVGDEGHPCAPTPGLRNHVSPRQGGAPQQPSCSHGSFSMSDGGLTQYPVYASAPNGSSGQVALGPGAQGQEPHQAASGRPGHSLVRLPEWQGVYHNMRNLRFRAYSTQSMPDGSRNKCKIGEFQTAVEAAHAYDAFVLTTHGASAHTNFLPTETVYRQVLGDHPLHSQDAIQHQLSQLASQQQASYILEQGLQQQACKNTVAEPPWQQNGMDSVQRESDLLGFLDAAIYASGAMAEI